MALVGLAPHGASGLKCLCGHVLLAGGKSRPARGEWIEIGKVSSKGKEIGSRPARGEWIEIT